MVVIVVDLSEISAVLPTALYWLDQVKQKLTSTYEKFEKKGLQLPEQMRQVRRRIGGVLLVSVCINPQKRSVFKYWDSVGCVFDSFLGHVQHVEYYLLSCLCSRMRVVIYLLPYSHVASHKTNCLM